MGDKLSSLFRRQELKIVMVGLDGGGKTSVLYRLKLDEAVRTVPTIGFNVERVKQGGVEMLIWDVGGQDQIRKLWKQYYTNAYAVVFVIDSADMGRLPEVKEELSKILHNPELAEARVLIFANKQDIPMAFKPTQIAEFLELSNENHLLTGREFYLQGCCALTGQGVFEGMKWLSTRTRPRRW